MKTKQTPNTIKTGAWEHNIACMVSDYEQDNKTGARQRWERIRTETTRDVAALHSEHAALVEALREVLAKLDQLPALTAATPEQANTVMDARDIARAALAQAGQEVAA